MNELPAGWTSTTLGQVCAKPQYGWTCKAAKAGRIKFLRTTDISGGAINWDTVPFCEEVPPDVGKYRLREGDIVISRAGSVGVSFLIRSPLPEAVFASYLIRFNPHEAILPEYLAHFLKTPDYWSAISEHSAGIAVPNVNASKLSEIELPLAPLPEQRRIVAKLEELLGKVDACQKRLERIPLILKRFRQSVLAAACSGRLTEEWRTKGFGPSRKDGDSESLPKSWERVTFESLCTDITVGHVGPTAKEYVLNGVPFLRSMNVRRFRFDPTGLKFVSKEFHRRLSKCRLGPGDLVIVRSGNAGMACVIPPSLSEANCADLIVVRPGPSLNPHYACICVNSSDMQTHIDQVKVGIAQAHFNIGQMRKSQLALPTMPEQKEIVRRVESLFKLADQIESRYTAAKVNVDQLTQSSLAKAFRGELVPQDTRDEPADNLLSCLRRETENTSEDPRVGRSTHSGAHS